MADAALAMVLTSRDDMLDDAVDVSGGVTGDGCQLKSARTPVEKLSRNERLIITLHK